MREKLRFPLTPQRVAKRKCDAPKERRYIMLLSFAAVVVWGNVRIADAQSCTGTPCSYYVGKWRAYTPIGMPPCASSVPDTHDAADFWHVPRACFKQATLPTGTNPPPPPELLQGRSCWDRNDQGQPYSAGWFADEVPKDCWARTIAHEALHGALRTMHRDEVYPVNGGVRGMASRGLHEYGRADYLPRKYRLENTHRRINDMELCISCKGSVRSLGAMGPQ
jgi:hypothetical protein